MKNVLIIEDDAGQAKALCSRLEKKGIPVVVVSTVKEAEAACTAELPNVIVLDIMLPGGMNGFDFLKKLKSNQLWSSIPVIVATNLDTEELEARSFGVAEYFVKSATTLDVLEQAIMRFIV